MIRESIRLLKSNVAHAFLFLLKNIRFSLVTLTQVWNYHGISELICEMYPLLLFICVRRYTYPAFLDPCSEVIHYILFCRRFPDLKQYEYFKRLFEFRPEMCWIGFTDLALRRFIIFVHFTAQAIVFLYVVYLNYIQGIIYSYLLVLIFASIHFYSCWLTSSLAIIHLPYSINIIHTIYSDVLLWDGLISIGWKDVIERFFQWNLFVFNYFLFETHIEI